jgi:preprotein translocase subunit SecG
VSKQASLLGAHEGNPFGLSDVVLQIFSWGVILVVLVASVGVVSAFRTPESLFRAAGRSKFLWTWGAILTFVFCLVGWILGLLFLTRIRSRLVADACSRGWWLASDGQWYPREALPMDSRG